MSGFVMGMGLGGRAGYSGPSYGTDGAAAVPFTGGYGDTGAGTAMTFGPGGAGAGGAGPTLHALAFGVFCLGALLFMAWALPR